MRCASCDCVIEPDDVTWIRGTALCRECWKRQQAQQKTWFKAILSIWVVWVAIIIGLPVLLFGGTCLMCGGLALVSPPQTGQATRAEREDDKANQKGDAEDITPARKNHE